MFVDQMPLDNLAMRKFLCLYLLLVQIICYLQLWLKDKMFVDQMPLDKMAQRKFLSISFCSLFKLCGICFEKMLKNFFFPFSSLFISPTEAAL
jgi:hypothetical protein